MTVPAVPTARRWDSEPKADPSVPTVRRWDSEPKADPSVPTAHRWDSDLKAGRTVGRPDIEPKADVTKKENAKRGVTFGSEKRSRRKDDRGILKRTGHHCGKLESREISLEDSFTMYQHGMELLKQCSNKIDTVEKKMLQMDEDGTLREF